MRSSATGRVRDALPSWPRAADANLSPHSPSESTRGEFGRADLGVVLAELQGSGGAESRRSTACVRRPPPCPRRCARIRLTLQSAIRFAGASRRLLRALTTPLRACRRVFFRSDQSQQQEPSRCGARPPGLSPALCPSPALSICSRAHHRHFITFMLCDMLSAAWKVLREGTEDLPTARPTSSRTVGAQQPPTLLSSA